MKQPVHIHNGLRLVLAALFLSVLLQAAGAQNGIVAYSDTLSVLEDATDDSLQGTTASPPSSSGFFWADSMDNSGIPDFFSHFFELTGGLMILLAIVVFLFPFLAIGLIVYLIYRLNREKSRNAARAFPTGTPPDSAEREAQLKRSAIRHACWGVGLIAIEGVAHISSLLNVAGIILLCIAAGDWLTSFIRKKKD